jgi:hypothetical protein
MEKVQNPSNSEPLRLTTSIVNEMPSAAAVLGTVVVSALELRVLCIPTPPAAFSPVADNVLDNLQSIRSC